MYQGYLNISGVALQTKVLPAFRKISTITIQLDNNRKIHFFGGIFASVPSSTPLDDDKYFEKWLKDKLQNIDDEIDSDLVFIRGK